MIVRKAYLDQIIPLVDKNLIKVLTGVRRSGKTVLLSQIQDYLLDRGVPKTNVVSISLESKRNQAYKNGDVLYDHLLSTCEVLDGKVYIFLRKLIHAISLGKNFPEIFVIVFNMPLLP